MLRIDALLESARFDEDGVPLDVPDQRPLRRWFRAEDFESLSRALRRLQSAFEANPLLERWPSEAFAIFDSGDAADRARLGRWVASRPDSAIALAALGIHSVSEGWRERGAHFAWRNPPERLREMEGHFQRARRDLGSALEREPKLVVACEAQLRMAKALADVPAARAALDSALELHPGLLGVRALYAELLTRRWGNQRDELGRFARAAQSARVHNPRLRLLLGFQDWDHARDVFWSGGRRESFEAFERALEHGHAARFYDDRGWIRDRAGDQAGALGDLGQALRLDPQSHRLRYRRAHVLLRAARYEDAIADLDRALAAQPSNDQYLRVRESAQSELAVLAEAKPRSAFGLEGPMWIVSGLVLLGSAGTLAAGLVWFGLWMSRGRTAD